MAVKTNMRPSPLLNVKSCAAEFRKTGNPVIDFWLRQAVTIVKAEGSKSMWNCVFEGQNRLYLI